MKGQIQILTDLVSVHGADSADSGVEAGDGSQADAPLDTSLRHGLD